jgi:hypothetical protein
MDEFSFCFEGKFGHGCVRGRWFLFVMIKLKKLK